jgi:hypothetical protein
MGENRDARKIRTQAVDAAKNDDPKTARLLEALARTVEKLDEKHGTEEQQAD